MLFEVDEGDFFPPTRSSPVQDERQAFSGQVDGDRPGAVSNVRREHDLLLCGDGYKLYMLVYCLID